MTFLPFANKTRSELYVWAFLKAIGDKYDIDVRRWSLDLYPRSFQVMDSNYNINLIGNYIMMIYCHSDEHLYALNVNAEACLAKMSQNKSGLSEYVWAENWPVPSVENAVCQSICLQAASASLSDDW